MASAETTSAGMRSAIAAATSDLPVAVGPKRPMTRSATKPGTHALQIGVDHPDRAEKARHATVAALEHGEKPAHRLCWRLGDSSQALALPFRLGGREPFLVPRPEPFLAQRIVGCDRLGVDAGEVKHERDE